MHNAYRRYGVCGENDRYGACLYNPAACDTAGVAGPMLRDQAHQEGHGASHETHRTDFPSASSRSSCHRSPSLSGSTVAQATPAIDRAKAQAQSLLALIAELDDELSAATEEYNYANQKLEDTQAAIKRTTPRSRRPRRT